MLLIMTMGGVLASFMYALTQNSHINFLTRRSSCDSCDRTLNVIDLIPVVGFLINKGRCKACNTKISINYFVCELIMISLFLLPTIMPLAYDNLVLYYLLVSILIPLSIYDYETMLIPLHMLFILLVTGLFLTNFINFNPFLDLMIVGLLHIFYFILKDKIGYGDIQLFSVLTVITPLDFFIFSFLFTYIIGGIAVIILDLISKKRLVKVPLVPFIATSLIITFFLYIDYNDIYFGGHL